MTMSTASYEAETLYYSCINNHISCRAKSPLYIESEVFNAPDKIISGYWTGIFPGGRQKVEKNSRTEMIFCGVKIRVKEGENVN